MRRPNWLDVEAQSDRVAFADDATPDAECVSKADVQAICQYDQPRRDFFAV
jgi:hypothetical protein